ncbi:MAG: hypothetical protein OEV73_01710 [Desulfobulbaceae bacterium]|nr:hypothetical protein [Desulfobulbaceae bacterium]
MSDKGTVDKLRVLLPHWVEHNHSHKAEFVKWAAAARADGLDEVAALIEKAVAGLDGASDALSKALAKVGGPSDGGHDHHHHHGHHHHH